MPKRARSRLRLEDRDVVRVEGAIPGYDNGVEAEGLVQDHPIERVAVMHRQLCGADGIVAEDRNAVELLGLKHGQKVLRGPELAHRTFDLELSDSCSRHDDIVGWIGDRRPCRPVERWVVVQPPQKGMRVEHEDHPSKSRMISSFTASKSGATTI